MTQPSAPELPNMIADDGDRPSITEVNGTVARFEMAYSPASGERLVFGPPVWQRLPSLVYLGFALTIAAVVFAGYQAAPGSRLFTWIVEGDRGRPIGAVPLAFLILFSAVGTVLRAGMRGVVVTREGVEARYLLALGLPRIRRWTWPQIDRLVVDEDSVLLELWDGSYERLPKVRDGKGLADILERVAAGRGRDVTRLPPR